MGSIIYVPSVIITKSTVRFYLMNTNANFDHVDASIAEVLLQADLVFTARLSAVCAGACRG